MTILIGRKCCFSNEMFSLCNRIPDEKDFLIGNLHGRTISKDRTARRQMNRCEKNSKQHNIRATTMKNIHGVTDFYGCYYLFLLHDHQWSVTSCAKSLFLKPFLMPNNIVTKQKSQKMIMIGLEVRDCKKSDTCHE